MHLQASRDKPYKGARPNTQCPGTEARYIDKPSCKRNLVLSPKLQGTLFISQDLSAAQGASPSPVISRQVLEGIVKVHVPIVVEQAGIEKQGVLHSAAHLTSVGRRAPGKAVRATQSWICSELMSDHASAPVRISSPAFRSMECFTYSPFTLVFPYLLLHRRPASLLIIQYKRGSSVLKN